MSKKTVVLIIGILCVIATIYYLIPGFNHVFTYNNHPKTAQTKHAILFIILLVLDIIFGRIIINRDKTTQDKSDTNS